MSKQVVIVESPAKAETINKYLGKDYTVLASYGHIRDLPAKNGSVDPDQDFAMLWDMEPKAKKRVDEIAREVKKADALILATDPDREGEAISWHVLEVLKAAGVVDAKPVRRVVFNEITKKAVLAAMNAPRDIDNALVDAYMARRALDYLVGFTLSPVLWRKLPGSRSAGRVQSVALRLICEREAEIEDFKTQEYWSVDVKLQTPQAQTFTAHLVQFNGQKIDRLTLGNQQDAQRAVDVLEQAAYRVKSIEPKTVRRNPQPPFITSTLQQEASRKLGFGASRTMQVAQKLYEGVNLGGEQVGLITYMRTDGVNLSEEAVQAMRQFIRQDYGPNYLPPSPRTYKSKAKNAQEAHEAIRPTDIFRKPGDVRTYLTEDQFKLYELIWKRALASQMENAVLDQVSVDIVTHDQAAVVRATGSVVVFDGFYRLYQEGRDDSSEESQEGGEEDRRLPKMEVGQDLTRLAVLPEQHFTKPPPRFTEASLVKRLEELGIGRPSTYASIIRILQDRNYVTMESRRFTPEVRGRLVTTFLTNFFEKYVQYHYTADLETQLDEITEQRLQWQAVLREFWGQFKQAIDGTKDLTISQVLDTLDAALANHFFPALPDGSDPRQCPACQTGRLALKLGRFGGFIGCSNYPTCKLTRQFKVMDGGQAGEGGTEDFTAAGPTHLGEDPDSGKPVSLNRGPYGYYVQLGEAEATETDEKPAEEASGDENGKKATKAKKTRKKTPKVKPKRVSLPRDLPPGEVTLEKALALLALPRELGPHPESGELIYAGLGRFGPYVKMASTFVSLKKEDNVLTVDLPRALELIAQSGKKTLPLGEHKKHPVTVQKGRFGFYIHYQKLNVTLPKGTDPESVTLEQAIELIEAKLGREEADKAAGKTTGTKAGAKTGSKKSPAAVGSASKSGGSTVGKAKGASVSRKTASGRQSKGSK
ncbi:MAG: type I DNA topoisomerase [Candidatus Melainabacteria bacterium]|nr:type I DNA topoisomerase [Candidatus Melainabacteria bacterium]